MGKLLTKIEIENIKLLLLRGLTTNEIVKITGRSSKTIKRVSSGWYDEKEIKEQLQPDIAKVYSLIWEALCILDGIKKPTSANVGKANKA